jgi:hypothetical protein
MLDQIGAGIVTFYNSDRITAEVTDYFAISNRFRTSRIVEGVVKHDFEQPSALGMASISCVSSWSHTAISSSTFANDPMLLCKWWHPPVRTGRSLRQLLIRMIIDSVS